MFAAQEEVDTILQCLPTADEVLKLAPYVAGQRPLSDLTSAEMFVLELSKVPQIEMRLTTFRYKFSIPEDMETAFQIVKTRKKAMEEVRPWRSWARVTVASTSPWAACQVKMVFA